MTCPTSCTVKAEFLSSVLTLMTPWLRPPMERMARAGRGAPGTPGLHNINNEFFLTRGTQLWPKASARQWHACELLRSWPLERLHRDRWPQASVHETEKRSGRRHRKTPTLEDKRFNILNLICAILEELEDMKYSQGLAPSATISIRSEARLMSLCSRWAIMAQCRSRHFTKATRAARNNTGVLAVRFFWLRALQLRQC